MIQGGKEINMKITDTLYSEVEALWEKAAEKEILIKMADGSLDENRYSRYMLQDYYYLLEYKDILERLLKLSDDSEVSEFLKNYNDKKKSLFDEEGNVKDFLKYTDGQIIKKDKVLN